MVRLQMQYSYITPILAGKLSSWLEMSGRVKHTSLFQKKFKLRSISESHTLWVLEQLNLTFGAIIVTLNFEQITRNVFFFFFQTATKHKSISVICNHLLKIS